jgi:stage V sporulation protein AD
MKSQSFNINNVYLDSIGVIVSKKEKEGPLGRYFPSYIDDYYINCDSFEKAQVKLSKMAIKKAIDKSIYDINDIKLCIAGDLSNQIFSSTSSVIEYEFPYIGIYAACASGVLAMIIASIYMNQLNLENSLIYTSAHLCVSQRQFRYPIEYGSINKDTTTITMTGACALILTNNKKMIKVSKATIGKIVDVNSKNINDMGSCMAFAAIDTFITHLINNQESVNDYDLIVTGDLGKYGKDVFISQLKEKGYDIKDKYMDCGESIYTHDGFAGASGPACVMCVSFSYVINKMIKGIYKKVLILATGALHSQISYQQKESIPTITHGIVLEVSE